MLVSVIQSRLVRESCLPYGIPHRKKHKLAEGTFGMFAIHLKCLCANIPQEWPELSVHQWQSKSGDQGSSWYHLSACLSPSSHYLLGYETHWSRSLLGDWGQGMCVRLLPSATSGENSFKFFQSRIKECCCAASSLLTLQRTTDHLIKWPLYMNSNSDHIWYISLVVSSQVPYTVKDTDTLVK